MGLDTSHDCWHGAYSSFFRWRVAVANAAGCPHAESLYYQGGTWPACIPPALLVLLNHSDCDGEIAAVDCGPLADALESLIPVLEKHEGDVQRYGVGRIGHAEAARRFVTGLREAAAASEPVEFR